MNIFRIKCYHLRLLFVLFLFGFHLLLKAEVGDVSAFKYNDFLPSSFITAITQDPEQNVWFATSDWICYFDGYHITSIRKPQNMSQQRNIVHKLHFDEQGRLWIATKQGLYTYDPLKNDYTYWLFNEKDLLHKSNIVYDILEDSQQTLFFATRNGLFSLSKGARDFTRLNSFAYHETFNEKTKSERIALCLLMDKQNYLWVGTEGAGLVKINLRDKRSQSILISDYIPHSQGSDVVNAIHQDVLGMIWIGTSHGLIQYDPVRNTYQPLDLGTATQENIYTIESDNRANLYIGTANGLFFYERSSGQVSQFTNNPFNKQSLSSNSIKVIFKDHSDAVWLGTSRGVSLFLKESEFSLYQSNPQNQHALLNNQVQFLVADSIRNKLYVGILQKGLSIFDPQSRTFENVASPTYKSSSLDLYCSFMNDQQELLIGTNHGIFKYIYHKGFVPFEYNNLLGENAEIYAIIQDKQANYYIGILDKGLFYIDTKNNQIDKITLLTESSHKDIYTNIKILHMDRKDRLWIVFLQGGIACYDPHKRSFKHYLCENTPYLSDNTIWSIAETSKDQLLIGTANGISIFDMHHSDFVDNSAYHFCHQYTIFGIIADRLNESLWLSTNNGIFKYKPITGDLLLFSEADQLQGPIFNYQSTVALDNQLFFGGDNGLNATDAKTKIESSSISQPRIIRVNLDQHTLNLGVDKLLSGILPIEMGPKQILNIEFSSSSYQKIWRNNYRYQLSPLDSSFHYLFKGQNQVEFKALPSGNYQLYLSSSNSAGIWSQPQVVANISVRTDYKKSLLYLFLVLLFLLITWGVIYRIQKQRKPIPIKDRVAENSKFDLGSIHEAEVAAQEKQVSNEYDLLLEKLNQIMDKEEPYLNKRFNKTQLATKLGISEIQLSQLLKDCYGKSYTDYINQYRVDHFKKMIDEGLLKDYTLLSIGIECGFNSKTSFYRVFKSMTGYTPSEYIEKNKSINKK